MSYTQIILTCLLRCVFVSMFDLILYAPSTIFQLNRDGSSWVEPVLSLNKCVLLKDHSTVTPVRLEPVAPRSRVKYSTTEPLRSFAEVYHKYMLYIYTKLQVCTKLATNFFYNTLFLSVLTAFPHLIKHAICL